MAKTSQLVKSELVETEKHTSLTILIVRFFRIGAHMQEL